MASCSYFSEWGMVFCHIAVLLRVINRIEAEIPVLNRVRIFFCDTRKNELKPRSVLKTRSMSGRLLKNVHLVFALHNHIIVPKLMYARCVSSILALYRADRFIGVVVE